MAIYTIGDLHLSFGQNKPMNIFGYNWNNHTEKIKQSWEKNVKPEDTVILAGDFSWATYLEDAKLDFTYINNLPGRKILLKGNHDYWWTTVTHMKNFLQENNFQNIDFLYNNSYCIDNKLIVGTRGWNILDTDNNNKMINRENGRLELSIQNAIQTYGNDKELIAFLHYPPIITSYSNAIEDSAFVNTLHKYNIKKCYYGHLHGNAHKDVIEGNINGVTYKLISADYLNFQLVKI